jgi:hypothetical protein
VTDRTEGSEGSEENGRRLSIRYPFTAQFPGMLYLPIGDIHGCDDALMAVVVSVRLQPDVELITPGDYVKIMVCGHTSPKSGLPLSIGHAVFIDTWACGHGWLTCLDVRSGRYWQANQSRQTCDGWLDP